MKVLASEARRVAFGGPFRPWIAGLAVALLMSAALDGGGSVTASARAQSLARPAGPVIVTVSGRISRTNGEGIAEFDRAMLEAMPTATIETMTPWTDGVAKFEGPLAGDLMKRVGAMGSRVKATATNDYSVELPVSDFAAYRVILAMKMNGETLRTRSKGPLWVIYPWSEWPELRTEIGYGRSIWQIKELVVEE